MYLMKNLIISVSFGLLFGLMSCEKENPAYERDSIDKIMNSNVFIMNSKENRGFLFEELKLADFPKTDADFIIIPQTGMTGDVMSPFLSNPDFEKRFVLADEFEDRQRAEASFNDYKEFPEDGTLQQFALNLKPNQVWLIRSNSGKFYKVLIVNTIVDRETSFVEIKFKVEALG